MLNKEKLRAIILSNWPAKVLSLGGAIVLFVFHRMNTLEGRYFSVPLQVESAASLTPSTVVPPTVRITLRAAGNVINSVSDNDIEAYLDLSGETEKGEKRYPVQLRKKGTALSADNALEITVDPPDVTITLDSRLSKSVNISPAFSGKLEAGYELAGTELSPSRLRLDGPEELVSSLTSIATEAIDLAGRNSDFTATTRAVKPSPLITLPGGNAIEFRGEVRPILLIRGFAELPIGVVNLDARFSWTTVPARGSLRIEAPQNELETWEPAADILYVDCAGITNAGEYELPLQTALPAGFVLLKSLDTSENAAQLIRLVVTE